MAKLPCPSTRAAAPALTLPPPSKAIPRCVASSSRRCNRAAAAAQAGASLLVAALPIAAAASHPMATSKNSSACASLTSGRGVPAGRPTCCKDVQVLPTAPPHPLPHSPPPRPPDCPLPRPLPPPLSRMQRSDRARLFVRRSGAVVPKRSEEKMEGGGSGPLKVGVGAGATALCAQKGARRRPRGLFRFKGEERRGLTCAERSRLANGVSRAP